MLEDHLTSLVGHYETDTAALRMECSGTNLQGCPANS